MQYLILAREKGTADALGCWLSMLTGEIWSEAPSEDRRSLIWNPRRRTGLERSVLAYEEAARWIEREATDGCSLALNDTVVLIDRVEPGDLTVTMEVTDGVNPEKEWGNLLAMLILSFPEIHWVFGVVTRQQESKQEWMPEHSLSALKQRPRRDTIFDPTGLAQWVKKTTKQQLSLRILRAAAIDEEKSYTYLHAYTAYRHGFMADVVTSWVLMKELFGPKPSTSLPDSGNLGDESQTVPDSKSPPKDHDHEFYLLLEDINLNFPDKSSDIHLSWPMADDYKIFPKTNETSGSTNDQRSEHCPTLRSNDESKRRIIITSSSEESDEDQGGRLGESTDEGRKIVAWKRYLGIQDVDCQTHCRRAWRWFCRWIRLGGTNSDLKIARRKTILYIKKVWREAIDSSGSMIPPPKSRIVQKPVGGIFNLWAAIDLQSEEHQAAIRGTTNPDGKTVHNGYVWPPQVRSQSGHSAPGKLMLIAENLIRRAENFQKEACTVQDYVKGAVMATEALELLGGMTPTMSLVALTLKHQYEVQAECAFVGVGYHFDVRSRIGEIHDNVTFICKWYGAAQRNKSILSAQASILNRIAKILNEAGRFEEESECQSNLRKLNRKLEFSQEKLRHKVFKSPVYGIRWYAEFLMSSFPRFVTVLVICLLAIFGSWRFIAHTPEEFDRQEQATLLSDQVRVSDEHSAQRSIENAKDRSWKEAVSGSVASFIGGETVSVEDDTSWKPIILSVIAAFCGLFHFGIFISYLYSFISRK